MSYIKRYLEDQVDRLATKYGKSWDYVMNLADKMIEAGELDFPDFSNLEAKLQK